MSEFTTTNSGTGSAAATDRLEYRVGEQTGTAVLLLDGNGTVLENNRVLPFGEPWPASPISKNDLTFTTYDRDNASQLDYAMARFYRSREGRFNTPDPGHVGGNVGDPQSWNAYAYSRNDPINLVDPTGLLYGFCVTVGRTGCYEAYDRDFESIVGDQGYDLLGGREAGDRGLILRNGERVGNYVHYYLDDPGGIGGGGLPNYPPGVDDPGAGTVTTTTGPTRVADPPARLTVLLNQLSRCPFASSMAADLIKLRSSRKLVLGNLGAADGSTSFLGTITIDIENGITAHNLGHEWYHTVQRNMFILPAQAIPASSGLGQYMWAGARLYNSISGILNGSPGYGPLDKTAEAFGQKLSTECHID
jgi:RHS repeat-associated protein